VRNMRLLVALAVLAASVAQAAGSPAIEGAWLGTLEAGAVKLHLTLHVNRARDGKLTASLDSVDQGAMGIPATRVTLNGGAVVLEWESIRASFAGALSPDGSALTGQFRQAGMTLPLTFHHAEKAPELIRPQNPKRPYPYREEEVAYENRAAGVRLAGTLTLPNSSGPHPAALLITGSGPQDRNETISGHQPFLVLADFLTRRGLAVLRADDRGVGNSTGKFNTATTADFAADARAGVDFLKGRLDIDVRRIGLIGHSEGAEVAAMVAARGEDIAFLVLLAAPGVTGERILYSQNYLINRAAGMPDDLAQKLRSVDQAVCSVLKQEKDNAAARRKILAIVENLRSSFPKQQEQAFDRILDQTERKLAFATSPWFRFFLTYDPAAALRQVRAPVLAVSSERDLQVPPAENLPAIAAALEAGGNPHYTIVKLPGLNHLLQTCRTGSPQEYAQIEETIAPAALDVIGNWIARHTGR